MYQTLYNDKSVYDKKYKVILVGSNNVGKTSIINRYFCSEFLYEYNSTIGVDFVAKVINYNGGKYKLHIWDTGSFLDYQKILQSYFIEGDLFLFVFDLNRLTTIYDLDKWITQVKEYRKDKETIGILIGNKSDIINKNIDQTMINTLSNKFGFPYIEISCKNGENIENIFDIGFTLLENKCTDKNSIVVENNTYSFFQNKRKNNNCNCNII